MAKKRTARAAVVSDSDAPVSVRVVKGGGTPTPGAHVSVDTGLTGDKKYLITIKPKTGRPVLIAVHL